MPAFSDTYVWIEAYGLDAQAAHAVFCGLPRGAELVDDLDHLASAHGMRELQARAALLRLRSGLPGALDAAKGHVAAVDNPVLALQLERLEHDLTDRTAAGRIGTAART